jgi:3-hydroxybutyryl-CoA dehydrogenase
MNIRVVGVVGAGVMGIGVAQSLAQAGLGVILLDISNDILEHAKREMAKNVRFHNLFNKQSETYEELTARIEFTTEMERLGDADLVIENATEKVEIKRGIYENLDRICKPACVFAANTSAISITRIASMTKRAPQVIGMHFMNPVPMKPVVEVIRAEHTSDETIQTASALLAAMGKEAVIINDYPGFVSNRVLMLTINEAIFLVQDQVAAPEDIDKIFKTCFGHKMGPLETADLIGLDTILYSIEVLYESYNDSKYRPSPLLRKMVDAGKHGMKSGQGFYTYSR